MIEGTRGICGLSALAERVKRIGRASGVLVTRVEPLLQAVTQALLVPRSNRFSYDRFHRTASHAHLCRPASSAF